MLAASACSSNSCRPTMPPADSRRWTIRCPNQKWGAPKISGTPLRVLFQILYTSSEPFRYRLERRDRPKPIMPTRPNPMRARLAGSGTTANDTRMTDVSDDSRLLSNV